MVRVVRASSRGKNKPRTKPPEVRRGELLAAAERIFVKKGVVATSVDEIVSAANVAKGTFYIHFDSKDALLVALRQRFVESFFCDIRDAVKKCLADDYGGRLRAWVFAAVNGYLDRTALHDVVFHEFRPDNPRSKHDNPVVDDLAELLRRGARAGAWSVKAPHLTAVMLFHSLHSALDDALSAGRRVNPKRLARLLEEYFRRVVGFEPA